MSETSSEPKFAALVGIDWGDKKHAWALQVQGSSQIERGEMLHTPEAIQEWVAELRRRFPTGCVAIALEQSRGPLVFALSKYEHLVLYPFIPPARPTTAKSFGHREPRAMAPTQPCIWTCWSGIGTSYGPCIRTPRKPARYNFWWKTAGSWSMNERAIRIACEPT